MFSKSQVSFFCLFLILSMFAVVFSGCKKEPPIVEETVPTTEITTDESLNLPSDIKYDDYEFVVLVTGNFANNDFSVVDNNNDQINTAKFIKNSKVEEQFGVKISNIDQVSFGSTRGAGPGFTEFQKSYVSGSFDYDLGMIGAYDCATLAYSGYLSDFNTIPYIDLDRSWWDQNAKADLSIKDKLYFTAGDISLTYKLVTHCILFNKDLLKEYSELRNPYELVRSNNWTYDTFGEEIRKVSEDLNANDIPDRDDRFGLMFWNDPHMAVITSANEKIVSVNSKGELELTLYTVRSEEVMSKYCSIIFDPVHAFSYQYQTASAEWNTLRDNIFNSNRALYYMTTFVTISRHRDMDTDFGILPYPKLNTSQETYNHTDTPFSTQFAALPKLIENEDRTGAVVEALAYYSRQYMTPAYYERTLTGTYIRDDESKDMLDLIFSTRSYDLGAYYNISNIGSELTAMLNTRQNTFASLCARLDASAKNQIESINSKYAEIKN